MTNTEFVALLVLVVAGFIIGVLGLVSTAAIWVYLSRREAAQYEPRHAELDATWVGLLPAPRTIWDRPHPGYDVSPLTAAEIQVTVIMRAVERAEVLHAVPMLRTEWVAETARAIAQEAGL